MFFIVQVKEVSFLNIPPKAKLQEAKQRQARLKEEFAKEPDPTMKGNPSATPQ